MIFTLESIELKILGGLSHQLQEVSNHGRRIAATRCKVERDFRLIGTLEMPVRDAVDVHPPQGSGNDGNANANGDEVERRCEVRGFWSDARGETCCMARRNRCGGQSQTEPASLDYDCCAGQGRDRNCLTGAC